MPTGIVFNDSNDPIRLFDLPISRRHTSHPVNTASVIDPYHPTNCLDSHSGHGTYTFRQRALKLDLTLGWELEANHVPISIPVGIEQISDGSVDDDGAEFVVLPAITRSPRYVLGLLKDLVHTPKLNTNKSCGFHVHVSASNLLNVARMRQWAIATEYLALHIQDLAFKAVPEARQSNSYCRPIEPITSGTSFSANKYDNQRRYHWLNTVEMFRPGGIRTIEIRLLGNTHRWKYLLAWTLFSMELARRGWDIANNPYVIQPHIGALGTLLKNIAKDIKPLEKKLEPIPQWVYDGLKTFGMAPDTWERPLTSLVEVESTLQGVPLRTYSDNQPEEPSRSEDDDDDYCPCGCGDEGRCSSQIHLDGDCDNTDCDYCHENGECASEGQCRICRRDAHRRDENCGNDGCGRCFEFRRIYENQTTETVSENNTAQVSISSNLVRSPISIADVQEAVNNSQTIRIDNQGMISHRMFTSTTFSDMVWFDQATRMMDFHEQALSAERDRYYAHNH